MAPIKIFFLIVNIILISIFGFVSIGIRGHSTIFSPNELNEIKNSFNLTPLMDIEMYQSEKKNKIGLFGEYKGFKGGHEYIGCSEFFFGTCENDLNKVVTCTGYTYDEDYGTEEYVFNVDKERCINYKTIEPFSYNKFQQKYYYGTKMSKTYQNLLNSTVNRNEECPKNKKKWTSK